MSDQQLARPIRKTIRLTFSVKNGEISLVSHQRLNMTCPAVVSEAPRVGIHSGNWLELRNENDSLLFHRILQSPFGNSVEVHSPDGKLERIFGPARDGVFEVLAPDDDSASTIRLMGNKPTTQQRAAISNAPSAEIARFDFPQKEQRGQ